MRNRDWIGLMIVFMVLACHTVPNNAPRWPDRRPESRSFTKNPPGFFALPEKIVSMRNRLTSLGSISIKISTLEQSLIDAPKVCRYFRLAPSPSFDREVTLVFSKQSVLDEKRGFPIMAKFVEGVDQEESNEILFWYDFRGKLRATVTLPPISYVSEDAGTREEFFVGTFLQQSNEWIFEGQRLVGPMPLEPWYFFPKAMLVDAKEPYASYYRTSAYILCKGSMPQEDVSKGDTFVVRR